MEGRESVRIMRKPRWKRCLSMPGAFRNHYRFAHKATSKVHAMVLAYRLTRRLW